MLTATQQSLCETNNKKLCVEIIPIYNSPHKKIP
jgi:hypothetical protein